MKQVCIYTKRFFNKSVLKSYFDLKKDKMFEVFILPDFRFVYLNKVFSISINARKFFLKQVINKNYHYKHTTINIIAPNKTKRLSIIHIKLKNIF